jgi:hypothetical protein
MPVHSTPIALVTEKGRRILLRVGGHQYALDQTALRRLLGLPDGPPGVGITIERDRLHFEFPADNQDVKISASRLQRRLAKQAASKG